MRRNLMVAAAAVIGLAGSAALPTAAYSAVSASPGSDAAVTSVSCSSAGNCAAGGYFFDAQTRTHAFVMTERNGKWGSAIEVPGLAALKPKYANITAVSCAPMGGCAAGGHYLSGGHVQAFVTT